MQSGKELEVVDNKRDEGKDIEFVQYGKERESSPHAKEVVEKEAYVPTSPYKPTILFPSRLVKPKIEDNFGNFVEVH